MSIFPHITNCFFYMYNISNRLTSRSNQFIYLEPAKTIIECFSPFVESRL
ncbi:hypothetical protein V1478_001725 [Vespula squamosa]|uniref:Uncharacterized protein n=1 Tax=Vespula squamosa TaxID=30214 RepID=A0ABD2BYI7_VESSQ